MYGNRILLGFYHFPRRKRLWLVFLVLYFFALELHFVFIELSSAGSRECCETRRNAYGRKQKSIYFHELYSYCLVIFLKIAFGHSLRFPLNLVELQIILTLCFLVIFFAFLRADPFNICVCYGKIADGKCKNDFISSHVHPTSKNLPCMQKNEEVISVRKVRQAIFHRCYRKK